MEVGGGCDHGTIVRLATMAVTSLREDMRITCDSKDMGAAHV